MSRWHPNASERRRRCSSRPGARCSSIDRCPRTTSSTGRSRSGPGTSSVTTRFVELHPDAVCVHDGGRDDVRPDKSRLLARNAVRCIRRTQGRRSAALAVPRGDRLEPSARGHRLPATRAAARPRSPRSRPSEVVRRRRGRRRRAGDPVSTFVVDWLGRGGIAQTSAVWAIELTQRGHDVAIATARTPRAGPRRHRRRLCGRDRGRTLECRRAPRRRPRTRLAPLRDRRPSCVVVQNYVIPAAELPVYRAARDVGARIVFVVHDDRLHSRVAGSHVGLPRS